ncbi:hypothetical protein ASG01_07660 [Chryseobacterium sp. Leaf180]|uniref:hypothetical protein n=1 Tax=Chryseobacterium sp. Leaf180 TaxID=1736289 RepID=UPI0007019CB1|nr:hypothetical protein [Chryseobacterium sp. Leaf180]KQR93734.1 hypothetical protein ASG01_07660 [Chryseobacterium sp. Leaf180]
MKNINKLFTLIFVFSVTLFYSQNGGIPPQPVPPGGGTGGVGTGAQASPIDMYVYLLAAAAVMMIFYYVKKSKLQKI